MASILPIGDKWRAQIRRKGHPQITRTFDKKAHAEAWARKTEEELRAGEFSDTRGLGDFTLGVLIERYNREIGLLKPFGDSKRSSLKILNEQLGNIRMNVLTSKVVVEFAKTRNAKGAGMVTVSMYLTYLTGVLKVARALWNMPLPSDIVEDAREILNYMGLVGKSKQRDRRPTQDELDRLYSHFDGNKRAKLPTAEVVRFAVATAMRAGEIGGLLWRDVNTKDRTIIIQNRKHPSEKIGNNQTVPLLAVGGLDAFEILMRQPRTSERVFPFKIDSCLAAFTRACKELAIEDLHFHDLRHEGVSRLFEAGYRIEQVALVSGHRDWAMLRRYTQVRAKDLHRESLVK
jgi:integrase